MNIERLTDKVRLKLDTMSPSKTKDTLKQQLHPLMMLLNIGVIRGETRKRIVNRVLELIS